MGNRKLWAALFVVFVFAGCSFGSAKDVDLEALFPEDSAVVMALNFSDDKQVEAFKDLMGKFPETEIWEGIVDQYDSGVEEKFKYEKAVKPILEDDWKIMMGMRFEGVESLERLENGDAEIYVAGKFAQSDKFEKLLESKFEGSGVEEGSKSAVKYWDIPSEDFYIARYGDIFFATNTPEYRDAGVERLKDGHGFETSSKFKELQTKIDGENLGYVYVSSENFGSIFNEIYGSLGPGSMGAMFGLGDVYMVMKAGKDNMRFLTRSFVDLGMEGLEKFYPNPDYEISINKVVPVEGLIAYMEAPSLGIYLEAFSMGFQQSAADYMTKEELDDMDLYGDFLAAVEELSELSEDEVQSVFKSPFAIAMHDVGELYPGISMYLDLSEENVAAGKKLAIGIDKYFDQVIEEFDTTMEDYDASLAGLISDEVELVKGAGIHKLVFNWDKFPKEALADFASVPGFDPTEINLEIYYGVTGDNKFVLALRPEFVESYGEKVLADDPVFKGAVKKLGDTYGFQVGFVQFEPLMNLVDGYMEIVNEMGLGTTGVSDTYQKIRDFVTTMEYSVNSARFDDDILRSDVYFSIE